MGPTVRKLQQRRIDAVVTAVAAGQKATDLLPLLQQLTTTTTINTTTAGHVLLFMTLMINAAPYDK
jgi:hypothetical protein